MEGSQILAMGLAFVAPMLISLLKNVQWSVLQKQAVALTVAVALSVVCACMEIEDYWANFGKNLGITIGMIEVSYAYFWERLKLPKIGFVELILRYKGVKPKR